MTRFAFTLIELLIVVAIIGILAAIAVPNFLNAQIRAKISRTKADMKMIQSALECYRLDHGSYMGRGILGDGIDTRGDMYRQISTPIAYLNSFPFDPFESSEYYQGPSIGEGYLWMTKEIDYIPFDRTGRVPFAAANRPPTDWILVSLGPDLKQNYEYLKVIPLVYLGNPGELYSCSNGILSSGDLVHTSWAGMVF
ncbi:MAG TPA: prepilin-type N-terminal cleavage/methylation domain-containing protein [bacterium]|nr:prepilin-type N-terminal cleavage/methylation domain-containing protein [bacterium]